MPEVVDDPPTPHGAAVSHNAGTVGTRACDNVTTQSKCACAIWRYNLGYHLKVTPGVKKQALLCPTPYHQVKKKKKRLFFQVAASGVWLTPGIHICRTSLFSFVLAECIETYVYNS